MQTETQIKPKRPVPESTPTLAELMRDSYTLAKPCVVDPEEGMDNPPSPHTVWLRVGHQSFQINDWVESKEEAEWFRLMLGKALARVFKDMLVGLENI
jgi:hypothetical protein